MYTHILYDQSALRMKKKLNVHRMSVSLKVIIREFADNTQSLRIYDKKK